MADHDDHGGLAWVVSALVFIIIVAVGATWLRIATLDSANDAELLGDIFGTAAGAAVDPASNRTAAYVSFALLASIFVITQVVAIGFGYSYGFASREGKKAFEATGGHANYASYWRGIQARMNAAHNRLKDLQRLLEQRMGPTDWQFSFFDYILREKHNRNLRLPPEPDEPPTEPSSKARPDESGSEEPTNVTRLDRGGK